MLSCHFVIFFIFLSCSFEFSLSENLDPSGVSLKTGSLRFSKRSAEKVYLKLYLVLDNSIYLSWLNFSGNVQSDALRFMKFFYNHLVEEINKKFRTIQSSSYSYEISSYGWYIAESEKESEFTEESKVTSNVIDFRMALDKFCEWMTKHKNKPDFSIAVALTRYLSHVGFAGSGNIGTACTNKGLIILQERGLYATALAAAHEIGLSLGAREDGQDNSCKMDDLFIMTPVAQFREKNNYDQFSKCSIDYFAKYINGLNSDLKKKCLLEDPSSKERKCGNDNDVKNKCIKEGVEDFHDSSILASPPGLYFTLNNQCQHLIGSQSGYCWMLDELEVHICSELSCIDPKSKACILRPEGRPYDGTPCFNRQWCMNKTCSSNFAYPGEQSDCKDDDHEGLIKFHDKNYKCEDVKLMPGNCYYPSFKQLCCRACEMSSRGRPKDCRYGDYNALITFKNEKKPCHFFRDYTGYCYSKEFKETCCNTCRKLMRPWAKGCDVGEWEAFVEHGLNRKLSKCILQYRVNYCRSLVRRVVIRKMTQGCYLNAHGYSSYINWYIGCIKSKHVNYTTNARDDMAIYEHCTHVCNENDYIGLFMDEDNIEGCKCISDVKGLVSVRQEFCWRSCGASNDFCGGADPYTSLYRSERSVDIHPTTWNCMFRKEMCQDCKYGELGYSCELSDCALNRGNCGEMHCDNLIVWGELFRTCRCPDGYVMLEKYTQLGCNDINECAIESICREGQICRNTMGSFACDCQVGYQKGETGACTDVDECNTVSGTLCDVVSTICFNSDGSYSCKCRDGFRSDDMKIRVCQDLDECMANPCDRTSTNCINIPGSFECSCFSGYHKIGPVRCEDDDECGSMFRKCPIGVPCVNLPGEYECYCPNGTKKMVYFHGTDCEDIDECLDYYICDRKSSFCVNAIMSYACICRLGFVQVDNFTCIAQDGRFTEESTGTVSSEISTNEPAEESRTTSNAFYFGLGFLIILCMFSCFACLCFVAKKAKSLVSNQSSGSSVEMEVHEEEILE